MEKLHAGEVPGWAFSSSPHLFSPCPCSWRCDGSSRPASEMDMGTSWKPQQPGWGCRRTRSTEGVGVPGPPPGVCAKIKNKKKKKIREVRLPRASGRTGDCGMWSRGRGVVWGGKEIFFLLLMGIVMVLSYFTGGVNIACYPVYLLKISV